MSLKIGVLGAGEMGKHHVRIYSETDDVELTAICDVDKNKAKKLADTYNTEYLTDSRKLLSKNLDAVSIVVPTKLHKKFALEALNKGVNVLVEKPMADSLKAADEMINAAAENNATLMVGHIERFNPSIVSFKKNQHKLGKIVSISARRVGPYNPRIRDVGIIIDLGVHDIDVMSYIYSEPVMSVHAYAGSIIHKFEDYASILLGFNNGNAGLIETNWLTPHKIRRLTVTGTEGIAYVDYMKQKVKVFTENGFRLMKVVKREPLRNEIEHFIDCIKKDRQPMVGGKEGRHALDVALSAVKSYKSGKVIQIP